MPDLKDDRPASAGRRYHALGVVLLCLAAGFARAEVPVKETFGWLERVVIGPGNIELEAKLDTGADTSSLDAANIRRIRRGDNRFVRFTIEHPVDGEPMTVERPLERRATIKRHDGEHQRRPVILMNVCLGSTLLHQIEVTLIDRSEFNYALLLGRSALEGVAVVDPEVTFTREPDCGSEDP